MQNLHNSRRHGFAGLPRGARWLAAPTVALAAAAMLVVPSLASADTSSTLTVVGTSDVSDSGLIPNLIQPAFEKAYPKFTFKYIGTATGTAITDAETGSVGASALIVHAKSLENQFVANGYSYEKYGRALWTNDFVLGGPTADPAGVKANGAHNVAQAFADVAAAGIAGKAEFVSRGGTPGTTVEEHTIWQEMSQAHLAPAGLLLCTVNSTNGGGETPIAAGHGVTASGAPCPNGGALPTGSALPSWYAATGLTQGPNVIAANACAGYASGANSCYVLTDRGTYDYLASGTDPAGSIPNLSIVTRDLVNSAPGGQYGLINYFHGYIINPSKPGQTVNLTAAKDFLNFITSPTIQSQLKGYLAHTADPGGAPFKADASPLIATNKSAGLPRTYKAGKKLKLSGTVTNAQPGFPAPSGVTVTVNQVVANAALPVASAKTSKSGKFTISFTPPATGSYILTTPTVTQIEDATLSPVFGDILQPASTTATKVTVDSAMTQLRAKSLGGQAAVIGSVAPGTGHVKGTVVISARPLGSKHGYRKLTTNHLSGSDGNFASVVTLAKGRWQIRATFQDPKQVVAARARTTVVTVAGRSSTGVSWTSLKSRKGSLTVSAKLRPAAPKGATVRLLAFKTTSGSSPTFNQVAKVTPGRGRTTTTLHGKLKGTGRWMLQLEYQVKGHGASYTKLRSTTVNSTKK